MNEDLTTDEMLDLKDARIKYLEGQIDTALEHMRKGWNGSAGALLSATQPYQNYWPEVPKELL